MTRPDQEPTAGAERPGGASFSKRLSAEDVDPGVGPRRSDGPPPGASRTDTLDRTRRRAVPEATARSGARRSTPLILPPAKVDATLAAQAARIKRAVAEARGELAPTPSRPPAEEPEQLAELPGSPVRDGDADEAGPLVEHERRLIDDLFEDDPDDYVTQEPGQGEGHVAPAAGHVVPAAPAVPAATTASTRLAQLLASDTPPDEAVAEAAAAVIGAMRSVEEAHARHLEAIEVEAARRCELLTAQSELDAELIRLHARREAHAIVSAAQVRTGETVSSVVADQLSDIGETFSRFAETIERNLATGPASPDETWA